VDPSPVRRAVLKLLGARAVLDPNDCDPIAAIRDMTRGRGAHASVDAAGVPSAFNAMVHGTRVDGTAVVVAIHHHPVVIPPFDLLMPEIYVTGVAMSVGAFPRVIDAMQRGDYPLAGWVETIAFENLVDKGLDRLRRQEGLKILVEMGANNS
jgi:(R,R)-butanediol dehydrogenase / meso-butanediol dehydrogenase / diacetyl reductase